MRIADNKRHNVVGAGRRDKNLNGRDGSPPKISIQFCEETMTVQLLSTVIVTILGIMSILALGIKLGDMFITQKRFDKYAARLDERFEEFETRIQTNIAGTLLKTLVDAGVINNNNVDSDRLRTVADHLGRSQNKKIEI